MLMHRVSASRLTSFLLPRLHPAQAAFLPSCLLAFLPGKGTADCILMSRLTQQDAYARQRSCYLLDIDLEKAYHTTPWWLVGV